MIDVTALAEDAKKINALYDEGVLSVDGGWVDERPQVHITEHVFQRDLMGKKYKNVTKYKRELKGEQTYEYPYEYYMYANGVKFFCLSKHEWDGEFEYE